jgi:phosphatidylinositol glycan class O
MQRIKGVTTGSLPTFIDVSANFGATSIEEDSLLIQLKLNGKKVRDLITLCLRLILC